LYPLNVLQRCNQYINIAGCFLARVYSQKTVGKDGNFQALYLNISRRQVFLNVGPSQQKQDELQP